MSTNSSLEIFSFIRREVNLLLTSHLKSLDLGPKQAIMLRYIQKNPKLSHAQLARATSTDPAAIGRAADSLIKRGLVHREEHPSDRRQWVLILSKKGQEVMRPVNKVIEKISEEFVDALTLKERAQFHGLLKKILNHLEFKENKGTTT